MTTPHQIVVATANRHKLAEITTILADFPIELVAMDTLGVPSPVEDGDTFEANALIKARACVAATGLAAIADDSGLEVDALDGQPGVHSARYAGEPTDDAANNAKLLEALADVPLAARTARFVCAAAFVMPDGTEHVVRGEMGGHIVFAPRGDKGFGYDPLFVSDADPRQRTNGELSTDEKDAISHRGTAFRALHAVIAPLVKQMPRTPRG